MPYPDINAVRKDIVRFFNCYDEIHIHQFGFLLIYLPVYQAIGKLEIEKIAYPEYGLKTDVKTVQKLLKNTSGFLRNKLHFGLSEIHKCENCTARCAFEALSKHDYNKLHLQPVISKLPLWGIARKDNTKVMSTVKKNKYYPLLGPKISAMDIKDFKDLKVMIYPSGTTVRRLFEKEALEAGIQDSITLIDYEKEEEGYDTLCKEKCDVCITIQPWLFVTQALKKRSNVELLIIYNKIPPQTPDGYTSIYVKKLSDPAEDRILNKMFHLLAISIWDETRNIYSAEKSGYKKMVRGYCDLKTKNRKDFRACVAPDKSGENCNFCNVPKSIAIEVINDSRIYHTHPNIDQLLSKSKEFRTTLEEDVMEWQERGYLENIGSASKMKPLLAIKKYFPYHWANNIDGVCDSDGKRKLFLTNDPIFLMSQFWLGLTGKNHTKEFLKEDDKEKITQYIRRAGITEKDAKEAGFSLTDVYYQKPGGDGPPEKTDINNDWRFDKTEDIIKIIPELTDIKSEKITFPRFYFNKALLKKAFELLDISKTAWFHIEQWSTGVLTNDKEAFIWLFINYSITKPGNGPGKFGNPKFNKIGFGILNGYWFDKRTWQHILPRYGHPNLDDANWSQMKKGFLLKKNTEAWLFTFRTVASTDLGRLLHDLKNMALGLYGAEPNLTKKDLIKAAMQIKEVAEQQTNLEADLKNEIRRTMDDLISKLRAVNIQIMDKSKRTRMGNELFNNCEALRRKLAGNEEETSDDD